MQIDEDDSLFMNIFGWVGTSLALFFFISPITLMYNLIKGKIDLKIIPWVLLIANTSNCVLWVAYGLPQGEEKLQVWVCNSIGAVLNLIYMCIYYVYLMDKRVFESIGVVFILVATSGGIFYIFYEFIDYNINGKIALGFNILMYAAPSQKILEMFKTGNYNIIPIHITIIGIFNASSWLIYGILNNMDWNIIIPNSLGDLFGLVTLISWIYYFRKAKLEGKDFSEALKPKEDVKEEKVDEKEHNKEEKQNSDEKLSNDNGYFDPRDLA